MLDHLNHYHRQNLKQVILLVSICFLFPPLPPPAIVTATSTKRFNKLCPDSSREEQWLKNSESRVRIQPRSTNWNFFAGWRSGRTNLQSSKIDLSWYINGEPVSTNFLAQFGSMTISSIECCECSEAQSMTYDY